MPVVVHCCAPDVPLQVVRDAGAAAVAFDLALLKDLDPLGEAIEAGLGLLRRRRADAGRSADGRPPTSAQVAERVRKALEPARLPGRAAAAAGGDHPGVRAGRCLARRYVRAVLKACRDARPAASPRSDARRFCHERVATNVPVEVEHGGQPVAEQAARPPGRQPAGQHGSRRSRPPSRRPRRAPSRRPRPAPGTPS